MADKVSLTIDGIEVQADPGSMIIQAAMDNGLYIPYLCYYPGMILLVQNPNRFDIYKIRIF